MRVNAFKAERLWRKSVLKNDVQSRCGAQSIRVKKRHVALGIHSKKKSLTRECSVYSRGKVRRYVSTFDKAATQIRGRKRTLFPAASGKARGEVRGFAGKLFPGHARARSRLGGGGGRWRRRGSRVE
jgi:hypothetical protein